MMFGLRPANSAGGWAAAEVRLNHDRRIVHNWYLMISSAAMLGGAAAKDEARRGTEETTRLWRTLSQILFGGYRPSPAPRSADTTPRSGPAEWVQVEVRSREQRVSSW